MSTMDLILFFKNLVTTLRSIYLTLISPKFFLTAVRSTKKSLSAGPEDLIPEVFIYGLDILLSLTNRFFNRRIGRSEYPVPHIKTIC